MSQCVSVGLASLLVLLAVPVAGGTDPCTVVSRGEAEKLLGVAITAAQPSGPETDEESGGMLSRCMYRTGSTAVFLTYVEFASVNEASAWYRATLTEARGDADTTVVLDDKDDVSAYRAKTRAGAGYTLAEGRHVVAAGTGGPGSEPLSGEPLRRLALAAAKRLPH